MAKAKGLSRADMKFALTLLAGDAVIFVLPYMIKHGGFNGYVESGSAIWFFMGLFDVVAYLVAASYEPQNDPAKTGDPRRRRRDAIITAVALPIIFVISLFVN